MNYRALIVPPEELEARVPSSGPLNEEHCILLAIARNPRLAQRRAEIKEAVASRQGIKDWRNPELRLSYGAQTDDFVRHPYTESTRRSTIPGIPSNSYTLIERAVTPGLGSTESVIRTFDVAPNPNGSDPIVTPLGTTYERETTTFSGRESEQFSALFRLQTPNRFVKKAQLERASCEIMLAEGQYLADEDKLVREVRRLFHDLSVQESTLKAHQKRRANFAAFRTEMENTNIADFAVDAARASLDMADVLSDTLKVSGDAGDTRHKLASLCNIDDARRIYSPGIITRRVLDYRNLDHAYLAELAMLYRADAVESRGRLGIAKARLAEANAEKIPWFSFIDAGYSRSTRDNYSGDEDEWMIRIGIDIPLFDWAGINKRGHEYQQAAAEWEKAFNAQRDSISREVKHALARVREAYSALYNYEAVVKKEQAGIRDDIAKAAASAAGLSGFAKNTRTKYDAEDATQQLEITRYRAYSDYNRALMDLEDVIGVRIEKALSGSLSK